MSGEVVTANNPCRMCHSPLAPEDLRCAVCALPTPANPPDAGKIKAVVLRCDECGAAMDYEVEVQAPRCAFCGSVAHMEESEDPIEEAEKFLPFTVAPEEAKIALRRWLGSLGWFRPDDLQSASTLSGFRPLWWVGWTFSADALISWTADSNAGSNRAPWAPHAGQTTVSVDNVLVSASRGLSNQETAKLIGFYESTDTASKPHAMPDAVHERFDVQRSRARSIVHWAVTQYARRHAEGFVPGSRHRKLQVSVLPRQLRTERFAFPAYVLAYRYKRKVYRAIVHGQSVHCVFGDAPYSKFKIALVVGAATVVLLLGLIALGVVAALTG